MSRSLAERIGEETRRVIKEREKEKREGIKVIVLQVLAIEVKNLANCGKKLFGNSHKRELSSIDTSKVFNPIDWEDAKKALEDIGFVIYNYPMRDVIGIPEGNVSKEIQELLEMYNKTFNAFIASQTLKANDDCAAVLEKLRKEEYEVKEIDKVSVNFKSENTSEHYTNCVNDTMKENGFAVHIFDEEWHISIIREEGD